MENIENEEKQEDLFFGDESDPVVSEEGHEFSQPAPQYNEMKPKVLVKSLVCAIIYSVLLTVLSVVIYAIGATSILGLIIAILLSIAFGVVMYIGGFYLILIPLPMFSLGFYGCLRRDDPIGKKILLGLLDFALFALVFVVLFALR